MPEIGRDSAERESYRAWNESGLNLQKPGEHNREDEYVSSEYNSEEENGAKYKGH